MSYQELEKRARLQESGHEEPNRQLRIAGERLNVRIVFAKFGLYRKRVSVEVTFVVDGRKCPSGFIYFERFESGRFYPSPRAKKWEAALGKVLPYASVLVLIALGAYILHVSLGE